MIQTNKSCTNTIPFRLKILIFILVCVIMFSLGVVVGRKTTPALFYFQTQDNLIEKVKPTQVENRTGLRPEEFPTQEFYDNILDHENNIDWSYKSEDSAKKPSKTIFKPESDATLTLQVGAFKNKDAAIARTDQLKNKGFPAYFIETLDDTHTRWYKVRIGKYTKKKEAKAILSKLKQENIGGFWVKIKE